MSVWQHNIQVCLLFPMTHVSDSSWSSTVKFAHRCDLLLTCAQAHIRSLCSDEVIHSFIFSVNPHPPETKLFPKFPELSITGCTANYQIIVNLRFIDDLKFGSSLFPLYSVDLSAYDIVSECGSGIGTPRLVGGSSSSRGFSVVFHWWR